MYALRLEPDFINNLTPEGRRWLARAVVNMINKYRREVRSK